MADDEATDRRPGPLPEASLGGVFLPLLRLGAETISTQQLQQREGVVRIGLTHTRTGLGARCHENSAGTPHLFEVDPSHDRPNVQLYVSSHVSVFIVFE